MLAFQKLFMIGKPVLAPENDPDSLAAALVAMMQPGDHIQQMVVNAQTRLRRDFNAAIQSKKLQRHLLGNQRLNIL